MEKLITGDVFGFQVNESEGSTTTVEPGRVYGRTKIYKNGELVHNDLKEIDADGFTPNAIVGGTINSGVTKPTGLKALFTRAMFDNIDCAIDNLFTDDVVQITPGATSTGVQSGKDGIIVSAGADDAIGAGFTMETITQTASNTYGRKWRGIFKAPGPVTLAYAVIGHSLLATSENNIVDNFVTPYATQTFPGQTLAADDQLTIDWEIFIA